MDINVSQPFSHQSVYLDETHHFFMISKSSEGECAEQ